MKKAKENVKNNNFTHSIYSGISLIVLVITIIVIIILAAAIIISLNNNNPIMEANKARYDSDVANMQAVFTNTVAKVMAKNQATLNVSPGQINTITGGVKQIEGEVAYTLTDAQNSNYSSGKIVFDKKDNKDTTFYTGKKLPIYAAGETKWFVDEEGNISLEVAGTKYGSGKTPLAPGLYDNNDVMLASWDELVNTYGMDVEKNRTDEELENSEAPDESWPSYLIYSNFESYSEVKLVLSDDVTSIGDLAFAYSPNLASIEIPNSVTSIGYCAFALCDKMTTIEIPKSVTYLGSGAFAYNAGLSSIVIPGSIASIEEFTFNDCYNLISVKIEDGVTSIKDNAFQMCGNLTSITIPSSTSIIGKEAFTGCSSLTSVYFKQTEIPTFGTGCFDANFKNKCTFYFKNSTVSNAFTSEHYNPSYGTKSTNYNW